MIRIVGAVLVVMASAGIGFSYSFCLGRRLEQLRQLERMSLTSRGIDIHWKKNAGAVYAFSMPDGVPFKRISR